jgi:hypothetical protein
MKTVAEMLGVARSNLHDKVRQAAKPRASYRKPDEPTAIAEMRPSWSHSPRMSFSPPRPP